MVAVGATVQSGVVSRPALIGLRRKILEQDVFSLRSVRDKVVHEILGDRITGSRIGIHETVHAQVDHSFGRIPCRLPAGVLTAACISQQFRIAEPGGIGIHVMMQVAGCIEQGPGLQVQGGSPGDPAFVRSAPVIIWQQACSQVHLFHNEVHGFLVCVPGYFELIIQPVRGFDNGYPAIHCGKIMIQVTTKEIDLPVHPVHQSLVLEFLSFHVGEKDIAGPDPAEQRSPAEVHGVGGRPVHIPSHQVVLGHQAVVEILHIPVWCEVGFIHIIGQPFNSKRLAKG